MENSNRLFALKRIKAELEEWLTLEACAGPSTLSEASDGLHYELGREIAELESNGAKSGDSSRAWG